MCLEENLKVKNNILSVNETNIKIITNLNNLINIIIELWPNVSLYEKDKILER